MNRRDDFNAVVKSAAAEASASRQALGGSYAAEFLKRPETFDPRKLTMLGRVGLASFIVAVGAPAIDIAPPNTQQREPGESNQEPGGWKTQRAVPMPFELYGLVLGTLTGAVMIFGCALVLSF
ncbi:MAG: hypothetical protein K2Z80_06580 [Xanthobacteraceae bacterium]|nr:hypothetical protein [Xanthobacteraceae bacterium]